MNSFKRAFFCSLLIFISFVVSLRGENNAREYHLVWEDNFSGNSLDENKWDIEVNGDGGGNEELQYYIRNNVSVGMEPETGADCLILTAKKEGYQGRNFTSARVRTYGKMSFKYGKIEGRIKPPKTANGLWPAFWMLGADYYESGWPKCGEIDILEMGNSNGIKNGTQERYFNGWFHWGESWTVNGYPNWGKDKTVDYSLQDDFHLYTVVWDENSIKMYLDLDKYPDTQPYLEMGISGGTGPGEVARYFHKPYNILLNLAVGGNFTGIWSANGITALNVQNNYEARMYVDYVKVYQKGDPGEEIHITPSVSLPVQKQESHYIISPNPASHDLYINGEEIPETVSVYNLQGIRVMEVYHSAQLDVSSLPSGNYIIRIKTKKDVYEIHRLNKK